MVSSRLQALLTPRGIRGLLTVAVLLASVPSQAQAPDSWVYHSFKQELPLPPLDTTAILVYDPTPAFMGKRLIVANKDLPADSLGGNWSLVDLTGTPSSGNPEEIVALIEAIAADPMNDQFAAPIFGTETFSMAVTPEVNVGFLEGIPLATVEADLQSAGLGAILETYTLRENLFTVEGAFRSGIDVLNAANSLALMPNVEFASVNWAIFGSDLAGSRPGYALPLAGGPDLAPAISADSPPRKGACVPLGGVTDPLFSQSWGFEQPSGIDIDALGAWTICSGDNEILGAVFDSGVDLNHPDLAANFLPGADFTDVCNFPPCLGEPQVACDNHGTAVAGPMAAAANGVGVVGIAPNVRILSLRTARQYDFRGDCYGLSLPSWVLKGTQFAMAQGVRVINISWNFGTAQYADIITAFRLAYAADVVIFNSTANRNLSQVDFPGNMPEVLAISGIASDGSRMYIDETFGSNYGDDVAISAPAQSIVTTDRTGGEGFDDETGPLADDYTNQSGTSYASPIAAGTGLLVIVENPALNGEGVGFVLRSTATDLGDPGRDVIHGDGFLNAQRAAEFAPDLIFVAGFDTGYITGWSLVEGEAP